MDYDKSIAKLLINNELIGTAWLIDHKFAITAAHCIDDGIKNVTLLFPAIDSIPATLIDKDAHLDVALLKLEQPQSNLKPFGISKRPDSAIQTDKWVAHGYPGVVSDRFDTGIGIGGEIRNFDIQFEGAPAIQLLCKEGVNEIDFKDSNLGGMSGAPVIIPEQGSRVVGIIRNAPPEFGERILVATPLDEVRKRFSDLHKLPIFDYPDGTPPIPMRLLFFPFFAVVSVIIAYILWPPPVVPMDGVVNVSIVEFGEQKGPDQKIRSSESGKWMSKHFFELLESEYSKDKSLTKFVKIRHEKIGPIKKLTTDKRERFVQEFAKKIKASVVIYGTLENFTKQHNKASFVPQFYVTEHLSGGEDIFSGKNVFGSPFRVNLPLHELNSLELVENMTPRVNTFKSFTSFILGLLYFKLDKLEKALAYFDKAEQQLGREEEVIYLFRGSVFAKKGELLLAKYDNIKVLNQVTSAYRDAEAAYQKALELTDNKYARAYIGLGNVLYDRGTLGKVDNFQLINAAIAHYHNALNANNIKPSTAYVDPKTYYNLGLAYSRKARYFNNDCPDRAAVKTFGKVVEAYNKQQKVAVLRELGAKAHYQLGLLYVNCADQWKRQNIPSKAVQRYKEAAKEYQHSISIATPNIEERNWQVVRWHGYSGLAYTYIVRAEIGKNEIENKSLYDKAILNGEKVGRAYENGFDLPHTLASESYFNLGLAWEQSGKTESACKAYKKVQKLAEENKQPNLQRKVTKQMQNLTCKSIKNK